MGTIYVLGYRPRKGSERVKRGFHFSREPNRFRSMVAGHLVDNEAFDFDYSIIVLEVDDSVSDEEIGLSLEESGIWEPEGVSDQDVPHRHQPDWSTAAFIKSPEGIFDVKCAVCGLSGSASVPLEVLEW